MLAVADTGPLYAVADADDADHERCLEVLRRPDLRPILPALVVTEVTYLVGSRLGPAAEAKFLRGLGEFDVDCPTTEDWARIAELVDQYADFPLGGVDAAIVALAERLDVDVLITLDRRHFGAVKPRHRTAFRLLPE